MTDADGTAELAAAGYAWEIADAPILHRWLTLADLAHALELTRLDALPPGTQLIHALLRLWDLDAADVGYDPSLGEVYTSREHWLRERIGSDAGYLHHGRTRREAVRTAFRLACRDAIADLVTSLLRAVEAIDARSGEFAATLLPDYTYLQPAQPTTFGHYLLGFADPLLRDARRLLADLAEVDASPAGSGGAIGSTLPIDRDRVSRDLGFPRTVRHLRDAMWQTDPFLHATVDATSATLTLDRLAEDLEIYTSREFGFISLGDGVVRPSVLMPQKRNPYALAVVRGSAATLIGRAGAQLALAKSPSARSDALIYAYGEVPRALTLASQVADLMAAVVTGLAVDAGRMREALRHSSVEAADVASWLSSTVPMDYSTAHALVTRALAGGKPWTASTLRAAARDDLGIDLVIDEHDVESMRDPATIVRSRSIPGGPGDLHAMIAEHQVESSRIAQAISASRARWIEAERDTIQAARTAAGA